VKDESLRMKKVTISFNNFFMTITNKLEIQQIENENAIAILQD